MIPEEKPWNMAELFLMRINNRLSDADGASVSGNMISFFRTLRTIKININFKLSPEEQEEMQKAFDEALTLLTPQSSGDRRIDAQIQSLSITQLEHKLCDIYQRLIELAYKYDMVLPKTHKDMMQELEEDFG